MAGDDEDYVYDEDSGEWLPASELAAKRAAESAIEVRDAVGNLLADGDSVTLRLERHEPGDRPAAPATFPVVEDDERLAAHRLRRR